uniref:uncharacterized protein LOC120345130 n=1 Tax=Styela clava TaxID=7725 RepID=UPI001939EA15|nr:uncharacterized protein LOC120345130 [Styela clava]
MSQESINEDSTTYEDERSLDNQKDEVIRMSEPGQEDGADSLNQEVEDEEELEEGMQEERMDDAAIIDDVRSISSKKSILSELATKEKAKYVEAVKSEKDVPGTKSMNKKELKEKQKQTKKELFGSFAADEIEWKLILTFIVFVFAISVAACTIVVFVVLQEKDVKIAVASSEKERLLLEQEQIDLRKNSINGHNGQVLTRMNALEEDIENATEFVHEIKSNQTENIEDVFVDNQVPVSNEIMGIDNYMTNRMDHQVEDALIRIQNQTENITENAKENTNETLSTLSTIDEDGTTLFDDQFKSTRSVLSDLSRETTVVLRGQNTLLSGEIGSIEDAVIRGFTDKDTNYTNGLKDVSATLNTDFMHLMGQLTMAVDGGSSKVNFTIRISKKSISHNTDVISSRLTAIVEGQDTLFNMTIISAVMDIKRVVGGLETATNRSVTDIIGNNAMETSGDIDKLIKIANGVDDATISKLNVIFDHAATANTVYSIYLQPKVTEYETYKTTFEQSIDAHTGNFTTNFDMKQLNDRPQKCEDVRYLTARKWKYNDDSGGIYILSFPLFPTGLNVFCSAVNEGWLVIMRLEESTEIFDANIASYKSEMGSSTTGNYWLGLDNMHKITSKEKYKLRIEYTEDMDAVVTFIYGSFSIGDESSNYQLTVADFVQEESSTNLNSMKIIGHSGSTFSTKDMGTTEDLKTCAVTGGGGWWYVAAAPGCQSIKLTGKYYSTLAERDGSDGIIIGEASNFYKRAEMSIKVSHSDLM